jgi:hypothetical protein
MDPEELEEEILNAAALHDDEAAHMRGGGRLWCPDPSVRGNQQAISAEDIKILKAKHSFLSEFSDNFIRSTPIGDLMRIESTAMKAKELEKARDSDDKLAHDKTAYNFV